MIDDQDIEKLKSVFATKDDLVNFATKDDLVNFATKDDLVNFATKDDLVNFATKQDFNELREEISDLKEIVQGIAVAVDSIVKPLSDLKEEYHFMSGQVTQHDQWIKKIAEETSVELVRE